MVIGIIIVAVVVALALALVYNSLVGKKNQVENTFASIDTMLKKRYDLIPNLVSTVQTYMGHEAGVLTQITQLRSKALSGPVSNDEKVELNNQLSKTLGAIMVAVENYPDLKANQNFLQLQAALNEIEEQISAARRAYNAAVTEYNNAVEMFPTNIMAGVMGFKRKPLFEIPQDQRQNVNVKDLFRQ